jgi:hypothetical protein
MGLLGRRLVVGEKKVKNKDKRRLIRVIILFLSSSGCVPSYIYTPPPQEGILTQTAGGAALGAALGAAGAQVIGESPESGAKAGAAAGGILGLLSGLFEVTIVRETDRYGGYGDGSLYGGGELGESYRPEDYCRGFDNPRDRTICEEEFESSRREEEERINRDVEDDAYRAARSYVRRYGAPPRDYCGRYRKEQRRFACERGLGKGAPEGWRDRENDIRRWARRAGKYAAE